MQFWVVVISAKSIFLLVCVINGHIRYVSHKGFKISGYILLNNFTYYIVLGPHGLLRGELYFLICR
jgi:hypothetical protein